MDKYDVTLYVYDITNGKKIDDLGMAKQFSPMFIGKTIEGVYHTSLVVYGVEYFFGGGICRGYPKSTPYGLPIKESLFGNTEIPQEMFEEYLNEINSKFSFQTYHIINNNCNHFTNDIALFLTGQELPNYIMKQHEEIVNTPLGKMFMPMIEQMSNQNNQFLPNMFEGNGSNGNNNNFNGKK